MARTAALITLAALAGCAPANDLPFDGDEPFVAVSRPPDAARRAALTTSALPPASGDEDFVLAVHRDVLKERWFLSAYLKQYFPGAVGGGAARSMGTRVVTFRVQNGKLFVFDADDRKKTSDTFDPTVLVEAYPIVDEPWVRSSLGKADRYVVIDPSAGLNRFDLLSDAFAAGSNPERFEVDLAYLQRFRKISDGVTWEEVFTGHGELPYTDAWQEGEANQFRGSGTLGLALRRYAEGAGFQQTQMPEVDGQVLELYFRSDLRIVANEGRTESVAAKWNIHPGMKPIRWLISDQIAALAQDPEYQAYDVVGAVKAGIEGWNKAFGFQALEAQVASADDSYADDDVNYLVYDKDPTYGAAFANWRRNPNTGEIRGASVYLNALWLEGAHAVFEDDPAPSTGRPLRTRPQAPVLVWAGAEDARPLCDLLAPELRAPITEDGRTPIGGDTGAALTKKEKVERYVTHVVMHEVGHTLGLRHNFKGSLAPPSSSVMDYTTDEASLVLVEPRPYDVAAIKYLYGLSPDVPTQPFCTDEHTRQDPDCARFDETDDPLNKLYGPSYTTYLTEYLDGVSPVSPNNSMNMVLSWVRAAKTPAARLAAYEIVSAGLHAPADPAKLQAVPGYGTRVDLVAQRLIKRLWLDPPEARGDFRADPPPHPTLTPRFLELLRGNLLNADKVRSFPTRRACVDVLKKLQTQEALNILAEARAAAAAERLTLSGADVVLLDDLLARIDEAMHPYFAQ